MTRISYKRHRFPAAVIQHAVWLYFRFTLSFRDVEEMLAQRGIEASYETIRCWTIKFGPKIAANLRRRKAPPSPRWHLDEMVSTINGERVWIWRAVDDEGEVMDMLVQKRRDTAAALRLLRRLYTTAHVKSDEAIRIRLLLASRRALQRKALDLQGSVRMTLKTLGARAESKRRRLVVRLSKKEDQLLTQVVQVMMEASNRLMAEVTVLDRLIADMAKDDPVCGRLMTIPGVGPITALAFRAGVDDPTRFKSSRTVAAHFGLTTRRFKSGKMDFMGHISKYGDASVRAALYSAASSLLNTSKSEWRLRSWGLRLAKEKGFKVAAVACARQLAVVMHRIWVSGEEFELRS